MIEIHGITEVMSHLKGLKAIVFDLDDTLYNEKSYVKSGYQEVAKELPQVEDAAHKLWSAFQNGKSAIDEVLSAEGIFTAELKEKCLKTYRFHRPNIHLSEETECLLEALKKGGYSLGLITDGRPEGQRAKIASLRLEKYIDHIIVTDELGGIEYRKPNEKAFIMMKEKLKVEYREMCYIGDNIKKDFIAPDKLGMKSIWFRNTDGLYYQAD